MSMRGESALGWDRDPGDLRALEGELLAVVDETLQPARAGVWLRKGAP